MGELLPLNPGAIKFDSNLILRRIRPILSSEPIDQFVPEALGMTPESEENALAPRIRNMFKEIDADAQDTATDKWMAPGQHSSYHGKSLDKEVDYSRSIGEDIRKYSLTITARSGLRTLFDSVERDVRNGGMVLRYTIRVFPYRESGEPESVVYAEARTDGTELNWMYGKQMYRDKVAKEFSTDTEFVDRLVSFGLTEWNTCLPALSAVQYAGDDPRLGLYAFSDAPGTTGHPAKWVNNRIPRPGSEEGDRNRTTGENDSETARLFGEISSFLDTLDIESRLNGKTKMLYADMPGFRFAMWKPVSREDRIDYCMGVHVASTGEKFRLKASKTAFPGAKRTITTYELHSPSEGADIGFSCSRAGNTDADTFYWHDGEGRVLWHSAKAMFMSAWVFSDHGELMQPSTVSLLENFY